MLAISEKLALVAELAIGLAGFSGLVAIVPLTAAYLWGLYVYLTRSALTFLRLVLSLLASDT